MRDRLLLSLSALLLTAGCSVELDVTDTERFVFSCEDDTDCVQGFVCVEPGVDEDGQPSGTCQAFIPTTEDDCFDRDRDGFLQGPGCPPTSPLDCNDDPEDGGQLIYPGQDEDCDGIDNNCDDFIDETIEPRYCAKQYGVCAGTVQVCQGDIAGPDCEEDRTCWAECDYGELFEEIEVSCDGLDNDCNNRNDENCDCNPDEDPPVECGKELGICGRGLKFCLETGLYSECVSAEIGSTCVSDDDCTDGYCVDEIIEWREDFQDDCLPTPAGGVGCERTVCRHLVGTTACTNDSECADTEICLDNFCQEYAILGGVEIETCNGIDDDCDGRIDEQDVCAPCPFNMVFHDSVPAYPRGLCIAQYEASRPDATASSAGTLETYSAVQANVIPWTGVSDTSVADDACRATAINELIIGAVPTARLCYQEDLMAAAGGTYPYGDGDTFVAGMCNDSSTGPGVEATGANDGCVSPTGVFDLSGNVCELVSSPFQGCFGGSAGDTAGADLECRARDLASTNLDPIYLGFRCCAIPTNN